MHKVKKKQACPLSMYLCKYNWMYCTDLTLPPHNWEGRWDLELGSAGFAFVTPYWLNGFIVALSFDPV